MEEKLEEMSVRFEELEHMLAQPDIIADQEKWQALAREHAHLSGIMEAYAGYKALAESVKEARELENGEDPELRELAASELAVNLPRLEAAERELAQLLVPEDPQDNKNVVLELRAGTGGEEAALLPWI